MFQEAAAAPRRMASPASSGEGRNSENGRGTAAIFYRSYFFAFLGGSTRRGVLSAKQGKG
jgi:hypothetical protein